MKLIITSERIEVKGRDVWTRCTRCGCVGTLVFFGVRRMPDGTMRNQPQCHTCRHLPAQGKRRKKKRRV